MKILMEGNIMSMVNFASQMNGEFFNAAKNWCRF